MWEQKLLDKFEKLSKSPLASLNQANGGINKKLDQNYQSLNLKHANRQSIPMFDPLVFVKYLQIYQNVWTWIGLSGLQKGGSKKLENLSKSLSTYGLQNLMARNFKSWKKNPSYSNWASKGLHKVEVKSLKKHKT